ncbi:MAG: hypothetical protein E7E92_07450, partial [Clostridiales bacterium]|nr:hypothetical protein [Clostridiales bacterium]
DIVDPERNYWFVRTKGGRFYKDFHDNDYIAIGWNKINFQRTDTIEEKRIIEIMKENISINYPDEKILGKPAGQIYRFIKKMKKGDIVLVPNSDTKSILFGEILEDDIYIENIEDENKDELERALLYNIDNPILDGTIKDVICPFEKRRKIKWIKDLERNKLDSSLFSLLNSHGAVSEANKYSYSIDRELSSFYIKGDIAHIVQKVTTKDDIPAINLLNFVYNNLKFIDIYNEIFDTDVSKNDVNMKLNVQSPGLIDFQGSIAAISVIALVGVFIVGGKANYKKKPDGSVEAEVSSKGLIEQIINFKQINSLPKNVEVIREELNQSQQNLKIESPILLQNIDEVALTNTEVDTQMKENDENKKR